MRNSESAKTVVFTGDATVKNETLEVGEWTDKSAPEGLTAYLPVKLTYPPKRLNFFLTLSQNALGLGADGYTLALQSASPCCGSVIAITVNKDDEDHEPVFLETCTCCQALLKRTSAEALFDQPASLLKLAVWSRDGFLTARTSGLRDHLERLLAEACCAPLHMPLVSGAAEQLFEELLQSEHVQRLWEQWPELEHY